MTRTPYLIGGALIGLALLLLLGYSLDRTSWLLSLYEAETPGTLAAWLHVSPLALGVAAAAVIEAGAVALIIADALGKLDKEIARYVWVGLVVVVLVQGFANLLAGFLRGFQAPISQLVAEGVEKDTATGVAVAAWLVANAAIPLLIFILAKLEARVVAVALAATAQPHTATPQPRNVARKLIRVRPARLGEAKALPPQPWPAPPQPTLVVTPQGDPLDELKQRARTLRAATPPASWKQVADAVGRSPATVRGWFSAAQPQE